MVIPETSVSSTETSYSFNFNDRFVIRQKTILRTIWTGLIILLLIYTGTIFIYRLSFIEFRIEYPEGSGDDTSDQLEWDIFNAIVYGLFCIDLFLNFFFSYRDEYNREVVDMKRICNHYLRTTFAINLLSCIPTPLLENISSSSSGSDWNQGVRAIRLQRMSGLLRFIRFARVWNAGRQAGVVTNLMAYHKTARAGNLVIGLLWVVHICACGWYIIGSVQSNVEQGWVARRQFGEAGLDDSLLNRGPGENWLQAMYFVLTVFSTVGFGDMSALTNAEIVYVCFLMMLGAIVHSIIISEVITVVLSKDRTFEYVENKRSLIDSFSAHTELDTAIRSKLTDWIYAHARTWVNQQYAKDDVKTLLLGKYMPRSLLGAIPNALYGGELVRNYLLRVEGCRTPPRLPVLLALGITRTTYKKDDIIYESHDYPFNLFMVLKGVFAFVCHPANNGSVAVRDIDLKLDCSGAISGAEGATLIPYMNFPRGTYFGDIEIFRSIPRLTNTRCETPSGDLLSVQKSDILQLMHDFPEFSKHWTRRAHRRENCRLANRKGMRINWTCFDLAAYTLQKYFWLKLQVIRANKIAASGNNSKDMSKSLTSFAVNMTGMHRNAKPKKFGLANVSVGGCLRGSAKLGDSPHNEETSSLHEKVALVDAKLNCLIKLLTKEGPNLSDIHIDTNTLRL